MSTRHFRPFASLAQAIGVLYCLLLRAVIASAYLLLLATTALLIARWPGPGCIVLGLVLLQLWRRSRTERTSGAYGTAHWATPGQLLRRGLLGDRGIILGRATPLASSAWGKFRAIFFTPLSHSADAMRRFMATKGKGELIRAPDMVHGVTIGPAGSGKGIAYILTNLLNWIGSVVVHDTKGELFRITAWFRRHVLGHEIVHLNFWNIDGLPSAQFNPLDLIDPNDPAALDMARALGDALVERTGDERDPHFVESAASFIGSIIAWVAAHADPEHRNLQTVRDVLVSPEATAKALRHMATSDAMGGMLRRQAHQLTHYRDRELGSVMTTVGLNLRWLDSTAVDKHMRSSSFDPKALRRTGRMSVYITIPEHLLPTNRPLLRLLINALLKSITCFGTKPMHPTLFVLDEAAQLGNMKELRSAVTLLRCYDVKTWWFFQDTEQVKECFPEPSELFNNCNVQTYLSPNSLEAARTLSARLGEATVQVLSEQEGETDSKPVNVPFEQPQGGSWSRNRSVTRSEVARHLLKPEEVLQLPDHCFLGFVKGVPPIYGTLVKYFNAPEFRRNRGGRPQPVGLWAGMRALACLLVAAFYSFTLGFIVLGWHERPPEQLTPTAITESIRTEVIDRYRRPVALDPYPYQENAYGSTRTSVR